MLTRSFLVFLVGPFLFLATVFVLLSHFGIRVSLTGSVPIGFYRMVPGEIERGTLVEVCPDPANPAIRTAHERGYLEPGWLACKGGVVPLLKYALALPGDWVEVAQEGILVNGREIENSARLASDSAGRPLPPLPVSGEVPPGYVWVFSGYAPESFDSRYFGPVRLSAILGKLEPVAMLNAHRF